MDLQITPADWFVTPETGPAPEADPLRVVGLGDSVGLGEREPAGAGERQGGEDQQQRRDRIAPSRGSRGGGLPSHHILVSASRRSQ